MKILSRLLFALLLVGYLYGCGGSSSNNEDAATVAIDLASMDLSGTWQVTVETEYYNTSSGDYLYSGFRKYRMILEDSSLGVRYRRCEQVFDYNSSYGVKTENRLYLYHYDPPYEYVSEGNFVQTGEMTSDRYSPEQSYRYIVSLKKVSEAVLDNAGTLALSVPFALDKSDGICVQTTFSSVGTRKSIRVGTMYNGSYLGFYLGFHDVLAGGIYEWERSPTTGSQQLSGVNYEMSSELAESFWGFGYYYATSATVEILETSDTNFRATLSLLDDESNEVSGSFEIDPSWLIFENN